MPQYGVALLGKDRAIPCVVRLVLEHLRVSGITLFPAWPTSEPMRRFIFLCLILTGLPALATTVVAGEAPDLLLAKVYHPSVDLDEYWVSEKYDGVRAYWNGHHLISRQGNTYHAPDWFTAKFPANPLDGELWIGRGRFEQLVSTVRKHNPVDSEWRQVRYMVFELPGGEGNFDQRLQTLRSLLEPSPSLYLRLAPQFRVRSRSELKQRLDQIVADGGEGLMLHRADAPYHGGRSRDLLKLKPWLDAEAKVIAHLPGKGKYEGMLGALLVETEDHRKFRIGTGFSDAERRTPPPVGAIVTYRYNGVSANGIPRSASFQRIRELEDEGSAISAPTTSRR